MPEKTIDRRSASGHHNIIGQRLKAEMKKSGISAAELARRSGVLTSFIYDIISGKSSNPSIIKLARVADSLGLNLPYLVSSELEYGKSTGKTEEQYISVPYIKISSSKNTKQGVISFKEEGEPYRFNASWLRESFNVDAGSLRMLAINGDSMEPIICHNDIVMINTSQQTPSPPGIFILYDGAGLFAKRLEYVYSNKSEHIRIISDNPRYSIYERPSAELSVVGRVVWFSREI